MFDLLDLEMLIAVAETGSLTAAAHRLGVGLNAVSRRLARLEKKTGVLLVQRTTRSCSLTEPGDRLYRRGLRICEQADLACAELAQDRGGPSGTVRVRLPAAAATAALLGRLQTLVAKHENLRVQLFVTRRDAPLSSDTDLTLFVGTLPDLTGIVARRVSTALWVLCASPRYLDLHGSPQSPEDLSTHECLRYRGHDPEHSWTLDGAEGARVVVPVTGSFESDDGQVLAHAVTAGMGIGIRPETEVGNRSDLVRVLPGWHFTPPPVYLAGPRGRMKMPAVRTVAAAIETALLEFAES